MGWFMFSLRSILTQSMNRELYNSWVIILLSIIGELANFHLFLSIENGGWNGVPRRYGK